MKSTIKHVSETRALVTVVLGKEELKAAEQVALVRLGKNMKVAGFRKGKAPIAMVAKNADSAALSEEILNSAVSKAIADAYTENSLMPLDRPEVEIKKFVPGDTLEFTAESDILPEVKLGDYKKLKAKKVEVKIEKSDVDDVLKRIKQQFAEKKPVTRKAEMGDEAGKEAADLMGSAAFLFFKGVLVMIRLENIHKRFAGHEVLHGIDLTVAEGEKVVIIGPSGSGKSTLVRCMNLLETPEEGAT